MPADGAWAVHWLAPAVPPTALAAMAQLKVKLHLMLETDASSKAFWSVLEHAGRAMAVKLALTATFQRCTQLNLHELGWNDLEAS